MKIILVTTWLEREALKSILAIVSLEKVKSFVLVTMDIGTEVMKMFFTCCQFGTRVV
jgi:hypothetical protein